MTDKQIIDQEFVKNPVMAYEKLKSQLKRKEQECENNKIAYQMELDIYNQECLNLQEELKETLYQLDQLKAELDQLKEQLEAYKMEAEEGKEINAELKAENEELKLKLQDYMDKYLHELAVGKIDIIYKLKQTLTEIKEICSIGIVHGLSADEYATNLNILKFDILQKISECEVE